MEMRRLAPLQQIIERLDALEEAARTGRASAPPRTPPTGAGGSSSSETGGKTSKTSQSPRAGSRAADTSRDAHSSEAASFAPDEPPFEGVGGTRSAAAAPALTLVPPASPQPVEENVATPLPSSQPSVAPPASQSENAPAASGSTISQIKAALEKRRRMFLVTALDAAHKASVEDNELCVEFAPEAKHLRDTLAKPESVKILREVCRELLGHDIGVRISVKERGAATDDAPLSKDDEARREKQQLREMAEQHPAVQEVLKAFHGEIVDVRRVEQKPQAANPKSE
jgi:hypothetical protein